MDRSLDSIGSCSLDVDADPSDISDTSGSLNFPTPLSVKDITREFTENFRERCTLRSPQQQQQQQQQHTTLYVDPIRGTQLRMVLTPTANVEAAVDDASNDPPAASASSEFNGNGAYEKKPSYLNLACCVNGYSNLTTYDSKIRQDINKSREVSPIRPSTSSLQYCKRNNSLAAPLLLTMPNTAMPLTKQPSPASKYIEANNNNNSNGHQESNGHQFNGHGNGSSFIQQRVERLYGPGALAQGFYSPKKQSPGSTRSPKPQQQHQLSVESSQCSELARKFQQLSPSKDYSEFRRKLNSNCAQTATAQLEAATQAQVSHNVKDEVDLPVFRHLSHEFRAQLPTVSPKRNVPRLSPAPEVPLPLPLPLANGKALDLVDHAQPSLEEEYISTTTISDSPKQLVKDGNYFLKILKAEQARLLALAAVAEKYTDALTNNPDITEETFGVLRSASGKARLLVTQKMKQFEGLCHKNLNCSPKDDFPTTTDDLLGFWDMVYLQVEHVDSLFADIELLKSNDWKPLQKEIEPTKAENAPQRSATRTAKTGKASSSVSNAKAEAVRAAAAQRREAQRKQLLEIKRQRREAIANAGGEKNGNGDGGASSELPEAMGDSLNIAVKNSSS